MKMKKIVNNRLSQVLFLLIMLLATQTIADDRQKFNLARQLSVFNSIVKELNLFYVDSIMPEKMMRKTIDGMLRNLDPYTVYYPEDEDEELRMMTTGKYAGIGSIIRYHTDKKTTVIAGPYEGMPAQKAGLRTGDVIISVDGVKVAGMSTDSVSNMLRGEPGSTLVLEVERPGKKGVFPVRIVRESIALPPIGYYGIIEENVGYILLDRFTKDCAKEMRRAIVDLKKQGAVSFIIDLRNNGGGLLNEAVDIVGLFVPKGELVVSTKGKIKQSNEEYKTSKEPVDKDSPVVVLVNGQSASASEILAGALQDMDRAVIVGSRTYGKGLVQSTRPVNGGGYLKLTTAKYYIPSGRCVQALDYSHMIDDGRSTRVPDSLTTVFHTAAGREVRDGGGIRPDVETKSEELSTLLYYLLQDMAIFDFATLFRVKNDTIGTAESYMVGDEVYSEFKDYLKSKGFSYDLQSVKFLADLKKIMEIEGLSELAKDEIASLEKKLQSNLDYSLIHFEKDVKDLLATEILSRYYGQKGEIIYGLREDVDIKEAVEVLRSSNRYKEILSPEKK